MNYQAFTNDSLTMMYEGIRGALESDDELVGLGEQPGSAFERHPIGKSTPRTSSSKCSNAECFSKSSIGAMGRSRVHLRIKPATLTAHECRAENNRRETFIYSAV